MYALSDKAGCIWKQDVPVSMFCLTNFWQVATFQGGSCKFAGSIITDLMTCKRLQLCQELVLRGCVFCSLFLFLSSYLFLSLPSSSSYTLILRFTLILIHSFCFSISCVSALCNNESIVNRSNLLVSSKFILLRIDVLTFSIYLLSLSSTPLSYPWYSLLCPLESYNA